MFLKASSEGVRWKLAGKATALPGACPTEYRWSKRRGENKLQKSYINQQRSLKWAAADAKQAKRVQPCLIFFLGHRI